MLISYLDTKKLGREKITECMCVKVQREYVSEIIERAFVKKVHVCVGEREKKCACVRERFI